MKNIVVVGSLNMDIVIKAPYMPDNGVTITGSDFMTNPGGKGANQAAAIGKCGGNCIMVGCVGNDFGNDLISALKSCRVNTDYIVKRSDTASGIAVIIVVDGDNRIILNKGANMFLDKEAIDKALSKCNSGDYLVTQLEIENEVVEYALIQAKRKGMLTILNPAPARSVDKELFKYCDYFIPNQSETKFYTGIYPEDENSVLNAVKELKNFGISNVVITMGSKGAAFEENGKIKIIPALKVNAVDTTAAGDTFVGAFICGLSENMSVEDAIIFAIKAAAITVTRKGAQKSIPERSEIK